MALNVLSVSSEAVPFIKTGGLADVAGALPAAVAPHGVVMTTLIPGYPSVLSKLMAVRGRAKKPSLPKPIHVWDDILGVRASLIAATIDGTKDGPRLLVLDAPEMFARDGGPYGDPGGQDWGDNWRRFAVLARAAADVAGGAVAALGGFDLLHAHDWQAGLAPAYLKFAPFGDRAIPSVMTIHNMAFQGHFGPEIFPALGLPLRAWSMHGVEYHGGVGMLKAGLEAAHAITTVSPTYALEIREPRFGMGLEGLINARGAHVHGVLNGIDPAEWNPASDPALARPYSIKAMAGRRANKRALEKSFGLTRDDGPLFVVISRLTWQKGMDVLGQCLDHLVGLGGRLALLGSGDAGIVAELTAAAERHPGRVALRIGYDEHLAHRMQAGGDAILVPSRFEPCGLTQLYGLAYGCVPVVARTGGLADTVIDANHAAVAAGVATGVQFSDVDHAGLSGAITRAITLYHNADTWRRIQKNGMGADFTWSQSGAAYASIYANLTAEPA
ncbi:glycogen synthase GlgA [Novosphingobium sp. FSY-8]|uniref:Glycogen synthase n=1 Tax=Novosphingobium ovatum TaxID=1908523 RepID=A0ABW9X9I0_9SPHN|nr:glycogen synthase GlgA [Novosphingobium ovatum]NBC35193.1 glycogen synthase GlgA [Novosphingobium ovatum]